MDARTVKHVEQLRKRRDEVALTLQYIARQQQQADENTDWLDRASCVSRVNLLNRLNQWYVEEMNQIDDALKRVEQDRYGLCLACHTPIERQRLELFPQIGYCGECQEARETLKAL
jgi:DnaK suppressor protein